MFGKMVNNYMYGKSGKADYTKDDMPRNRWQLFFTTLRIRFSGIVRLNLIYMLIFIPLIVWTAMNLIAVMNLAVKDDTAAAGGDAAIVETVEAAPSADGTVLTDTAAATEDAVDTTTYVSNNSEYVQYLLNYLYMYCLILIPCILITGPFTAGVAYVTRNWARDDHAFVWSDFKDALKDNWKPALGISAITSVIPIVLYTANTFYYNMATTNGYFYIVPQVIVNIVCAIWCLGCMYFYPLIVTYDLKFTQVIRNGLLLAIGRLPMNVGLRLLCCLPCALMFIIPSNYVFLFVLLYFVIMGYTFHRFIYASYTNAVFDRFINSRIEGAEVNKGINTEDPDLDPDEAESSVPKSDIKLDENGNPLFKESDKLD